MRTSVIALHDGCVKHTSDGGISHGVRSLRRIISAQRNGFIGQTKDFAALVPPEAHYTIGVNHSFYVTTYSDSHLRQDKQ